MVNAFLWFVCGYVLMTLFLRWLRRPEPNCRRCGRPRGDCDVIPCNLR